MFKSDSLYKAPFSPSYWQAALSEIKKPKVLALAAFVIAIRIVISSFFIPLPFGNLRIYFGFFANALGSLIYGPVVALVVGFVHDILSYIISPTGPFFPGYTLSTMLGSFVYAMFLYRARITVFRIALCKLSVNLFVNVMLGSLWSAILYNKGYYYYMTTSILKNTSLLIPEIIVLVLFIQMMLPLISKHGLISKQTPRRIPWI